MNDPNGPVERLGRSIRTLASAPRSVDALLGAGQASLDLGDANAALGFFARAEEAAPSNGRAKAGLASALVMSERADDALRLFAQATSLGVSDADIARDRGLAYDLRGDSVRAQRDYALALSRGSDDELLRRYGLSLAISGDRSGALARIDPLLRKQDQGAWRARAFILAMTGDVQGANRVAHQLMVPAVADSMAPLLARLATLNAAQRAHAVNFGTVPGDGTQMAAVATGDPYLRQTSPSRGAPAGGVPSTSTPTSGALAAGAGLIPRGAPLGTVVSPTAQPIRTAQADTGRPRRPDRTAEVASATPLAPPTPTPALTPTPTPPSGAAPTPASAFPRTLDQRVAALDRSQLPPVARGEFKSATVLPRTTLPAPDDPRPLGEVAPAPAAMARAPGSTAPGVAVAPSGSAERPPSVPDLAPVRSLPAPAPAPAPAPTVLSTPKPVSAPVPRAVAATPTDVIGPRAEAGEPGQGGVDAGVRAGVAPAAASPTDPARVATPTTGAPGATRLAGLLEGVEREPETAVELPNARELRTARAAAKRKLAELAAQAAKEKAVKDQAARDKAAKAQAVAEATAKAAAAKRFPARVWVQVATGRADSSLTWKRLKGDNEAALKGLSAWSSPYKSTNRILAGPVKSVGAARELVKALGKNGVGAMTYSSEAGEEVFKIGTK